MCNLVHIVIRTQAPKTIHHVPVDLESGRGITPTSALGFRSFDLTAMFSLSTALYSNHCSIYQTKYISTLPDLTAVQPTVPAQLAWPAPLYRYLCWFTCHSLGKSATSSQISYGWNCWSSPTFNSTCMPHFLSDGTEVFNNLIRPQL